MTVLKTRTTENKIRKCTQILLRSKITDTMNSIQLPPDDANWSKNNPKGWPMLVYEDLVDYLILKKAYDGKEMRAFRSLYGKNYVESKWLGDVYDCKIGELHFFKSSLSPSQPGVGRVDYKSWAVMSDGNIVTGHCTCPAGAGGSCSHIAAVLYAVIMAWEYGIAGETCTDKARMWGRGASKVLQCHGDFEEIVKENKVRKTKVKKTTCDDKCPRPHQFLNHNDLEESHDISNPKSPGLPSCTPCKTFFDKFVQIGERNISTLKENTSEQSTLKENTSEQTSLLWLDSRKVRIINRITASKVNSLPKTARANPDKYVTSHIYNRFKGSVATKHGNKFEPTAGKWFEDTCGLSVKWFEDTSGLSVKWFEDTSGLSVKWFEDTSGLSVKWFEDTSGLSVKWFEDTSGLSVKWFEDTSGLSVMKSGIVVRCDEQYLAASPHGIIDENTILEIKCPTKSVQELVNSGKYDVCLDKKGEAYLNPKGKNGYYSQVQMTMYCTKTSLCKFVVWTAHDQIVVDVPFDKDFMDSILPRIRSFYFKHLLVRLADEYHFSRLELAPAYRELCITVP